MYVSPDGSDSNDGSAASPFKTIEKAKETVRTLDKSGGDIVVKIADGFYSLDDTLLFSEEDSGNENCTIYYEAEEGAAVSYTHLWKRLASKIHRIQTKEEQRLVGDMIRKMEVKTPDEKTKVSSLSGGNQQKISIGKWLAAQCDILIIDEPTVGVDIGAKEYIHDLIWDLADKEHKSIILISSDMPELISLSRRILVFNDQKIVGEINNLNERELSYAEVSEKIGEYLA